MEDQLYVACGPVNPKSNFWSYLTHTSTGHSDLGLNYDTSMKRGCIDSLHDFYEGNAFNLRFATYSKQWAWNVSCHNKNVYWNFVQSVNI